MNNRDDLKTIADLWKKSVEAGKYSSIKHLWKALPSLYRERDLVKKDEKGDLQLYLEGFGIILDRIKKTLEQRLRDTSPLTCQSWLLPYFADMLDVHLLSPDPEGQRQEIAHAIRWRQRKGTIAICAEIAESVGQMPVIVFEGYKSIARTARIGDRLPSQDELGEKKWEEEPHTPSHLSERPGTPAITVDFRKPSTPFQVKGKPTPLSIKSRFGDEEIHWQHENPPHGVLCHPGGGYRDVSIRTVDTRTPAWKAGHYHPKRLRLYTPVFEGFMTTEPALAKKAIELVMSPMTPPVSWDNSNIKGGYKYKSGQDGTTINLKKNSLEYVCIEERLIPADTDTHDNYSQDLTIRRTLVTLAPGSQFKSLFPDIYPNDWIDTWDTNNFLLQWERTFDKKQNAWHTTIRGGTWDHIKGKPGNAGNALPERGHLKEGFRWPTLLSSRKTLEITLPKSDIPHIVRIERLVLPGKLKVHADRCIVSTCAVKSLEVLTQGLLPEKYSPAQVLKSPHIKARDCLIRDFKTSGLIVELEYCTVNADWKCEEVRASDCILLGSFYTDSEKTAVIPMARLRYCSVQQLPVKNLRAAWVIHENSVTTRAPELYHQYIEKNGIHKLYSDAFGKPGYGVLHQATHQSICHGAENGGELGALHHLRYCGRQDAVVEKLANFLPVGMVPVLIVDRYWQAPAERETK